MQVAVPSGSNKVKPFQDLKLGVPESADLPPVLVLNPDHPLVMSPPVDSFEIRGHIEPVIPEPVAPEPEANEEAWIRRAMAHLQNQDRPIGDFVAVLNSIVQEHVDQLTQDYPEFAEQLTAAARRENTDSESTGAHTHAAE